MHPRSMGSSFALSFLASVAGCSSPAASPESSGVTRDGGSEARPDARGDAAKAPHPSSKPDAAPPVAPVDASRDLDASVAVGCDAALGSFSAEAWPPACYPFYASTSFVRTKVPAAPNVDPNSSTILQFYAGYLNGFGGLGSLNLGDPDSTNDYGHPLYFGRPIDPLFSLHCLNDAQWGNCPIEGASVHIPNGAKPAGGSDGHLGVIDQATGAEYDLWQVQRDATDGGVLDCTYGGLGSLTGSGFTSGSATASNLDLGAGSIRSEELMAGVIDHVIFGVVACCNGTAVGPTATAGGHCDTTCANGQGGAVGELYVLDMTDAEIEALGKSAAGTAVLKAMAHYGIVDGDENNYGFGLNAVIPSVSRTSVGGSDPIVAWAEAEGLPKDGQGGYTLDYGSGVDWASKLIVVVPP